MPLLVPGANHLISGSVLDEKMAALDVICQTWLKAVPKFEFMSLSAR